MAASDDALCAQSLNIRFRSLRCQKDRRDRTERSRNRNKRNQKRKRLTRHLLRQSADRLGFKRAVPHLDDRHGIGISTAATLSGFKSPLMAAQPAVGGAGTARLHLEMADAWRLAWITVEAQAKAFSIPQVRVAGDALQIPLQLVIAGSHPDRLSTIRFADDPFRPTLIATLSAFSPVYSADIAVH